jgi:hypothetical protein
VKNLRKQPACGVRVRGQHIPGRARILDGGEEDARARRLLVEKYSPREDDSLED